jgi:hypothetical protein
MFACGLNRALHGEGFIDKRGRLRGFNGLLLPRETSLESRHLLPRTCEIPVTLTVCTKSVITAVKLHVYIKTIGKVPTLLKPNFLVFQSFGINYGVLHSNKPITVAARCKA